MKCYTNPKFDYSGITLDDLGPEIWLPERIQIFHIDMIPHIPTLKNGIYYAGKITNYNEVDVYRQIFNAVIETYIHSENYAGSKTREYLQSVSHYFKPLTNIEREKIYELGINPILIMRNVGPVIWGQQIRYQVPEDVTPLETIAELVVVKSTQAYVNLIYHQALNRFQDYPMTRDTKIMFKYTLMALLEKLKFKFVHTRMVFDLQWCIQDIDADELEPRFTIFFKIFSNQRGMTPIDMQFDHASGFDKYTDLNEWF